MPQYLKPHGRPTLLSSGSCHRAGAQAVCGADAIHKHDGPGQSYPSLVPLSLSLSLSLSLFLFLSLFLSPCPSLSVSSPPLAKKSEFAHLTARWHISVHATEGKRGLNQCLSCLSAESLEFDHQGRRNTSGQFSRSNWVCLKSSPPNPLVCGSSHPQGVLCDIP